MTEHKCQGQVFGHYRMHLCGKKAGYEHEGRWFCKTHHPPTIEEKQAVKTAKWNAEWDAKMAREKKAKEDKAEMERKAAMYDELLVALKVARSIIGHPDDTHSQHIAAIIAKAEGETK